MLAKKGGVGRRRASAAATAGPLTNSTGHHPPAPRGQGGGREEAPVARAAEASQVTCGICGGGLREAITLSECLHAFCRNCISDKLEGIKCCPTCGVHLGHGTKEKLRSDHDIDNMTCKRHKVSTEVEMIDDADEDLNFAPVGRNVLTVQQQQPILGTVPLDQLAPRNDLETFEPPAVAGSSFHATRMTVQDENYENLKGDIHKFYDENRAKVMERYDVYISQLKADNSKLIEELKNENAAAVEKIEILESQNQSLKEKNTKLHEKLENEKEYKEDMMSCFVSKSVQLDILEHCSDILESEKIGLENQVEHMKKELENAKKERERSIRRVLEDVNKSCSRELGDNPY